VFSWLENFFSEAVVEAVALSAQHLIQSLNGNCRDHTILVFVPGVPEAEKIQDQLLRDRRMLFNQHRHFSISLWDYF